MIDIAPSYRKCLALMTIEQLEEAEKILWTGDNPASRKVVAEIQIEKAKRTKSA